MQTSLEEVLSQIHSVPSEYLYRAREHLDRLTKPIGSLGKLEEMAARFIAIQGRDVELPLKKGIFIFAADHGVTEEGVSAYPQEVTAQMVKNFLNGGAAINVLARHFDATTTVVDMGVNWDLKGLAGLRHNKIALGTGNIAKGPAMTRTQAEQALQTGIDLANEFAKKEFNLLGAGDMGIGNTTASAAILSVIGEQPVDSITGRGTGIDDPALKKKIETIKKAVELNNPDLDDPIDVLAKLGGFEIGGMAGLVLGAAANKIPVVVDGLISGAAAILAYEIAPSIRDYLFLSHKSQEPAHQVCFDILEMKPYFDLEMRLGEGTGAAIAMNLVEASVKIYKEMATFEGADISEKQG